MPEFVLHRIADDDVEKLSTCIASWASDLNGTIDVDEVSRSLKLSSSHGLSVAAYDGDAPVGVITGHAKYNPLTRKLIAHESWVVVHPNYRKQGLSAMLGQALYGWAKLGKCDAVMFYPCSYSTVDPLKLVKTLTDHGCHLHGFQMMKEVT